MDLRDTARTVRTRWKVVTAGVVLGAGAALGYSLLSTPVYASSTQLFVSTADAGTATAVYQGNLASQQRVSSYAELLKGRQVAQRVVDELGLPISASALAQQVSVTVVPDTVLLEVSVADPSPAAARELADGVAGQLITLVEQLETPAGGGPASARVTVVSPAAEPTTPVTPKTSRNVALGALLGLLGGLGAALLRDRLDNTVKTTEDVTAATGGAVIGTLRFDTDRPAQPLVRFSDGHSASAEAFRQVRTNLQFVDVDRSPSVFTVTSSLPGEGKTTTAINLAHVLAESGNRVVLVDADLRRPRVARYLGLVEEVGLTTVLSGAAPLEDVLQTSAGSRVSVLASGPHPPNPSELLGSGQMKALLAQLRERADYVVLDAPPLLPVTDAAVLATVTDGALVVARHGTTTREQLTRATEHLRAVGAVVLGNVLNMTPASGSEDYGYYYGDTQRGDAAAVPAPAVPDPAAAVVPDPAAAVVVTDVPSPASRHAARRDRAAAAHAAALAERTPAR